MMRFHTKLLQMKNIKYIVVIGFIIFSTIMVAQPTGYVPISGNAKTEMAKKINTVSAQLQTLQVSFEQEKTSKLFVEKVVSKGTMLYKKPGLLNWAYTTPSVYSIIINSRGAFLKNASGTTKNKMIGDLGAMILQTINGTGLVSNSNFSIEYYKKSDLLVLLKPVNKRLKSMYSTIEVYLNPQNYLASKVKMSETNGDVTVITFHNPQKNIAISESKFSEK